MATILGSLESLIHDTTQALIDSQITTKVSDMYTGFISSGFRRRRRDAEGGARHHRAPIAPDTVSRPVPSQPSNPSRRFDMHTGHYDCCSHHHFAAPCYPCYVPVVWIAMPAGACAPLKVPREIDADSTSTSDSAPGGRRRRQDLACRSNISSKAARPRLR